MIEPRLHFRLATVLLVAAPFVAWAVQWGHDQLTLRRLARLDPPIAVLAAPEEDPARSAGVWLLVALRDRDLYTRAADFCRQHDDLPLPNCDNLLVADRLLPLLPTDAGHREVADAR